MCEKNCTSCEPCRQENEKENRFSENKILFTDSAVFNKDEKNLISITDGVITYLGLELGKLPHNKYFRVMRTPAEVERIYQNLVGIPITDDHIDTDGEAYNVVGKIETSELVDLNDTNLFRTLGVKNKVTFNDDFVFEEGAQGSLGYTGDLIKANPEDPFDFYQENIEPHHYAFLRNKKGRCGEACKFTDEDAMAKKLKNSSFKDEDGTINLQDISEVIDKLPDTLTTMDVEEVKKIVMMLKTVIAEVAAAREAAQAGKDEAANSAEDADSIEATEIETTDEGEKVEEKEEDKTILKDKGSEEDADIKKLKTMDSASFKDAISKMVDEEVKSVVTVIGKAKTFLDSEYSFSGKNKNQIMRDALATQYKIKFADHELPVAFKMLKKVSVNVDFKDEADQVKQNFETLKTKEL